MNQALLTSTEPALHVAQVAPLLGLVLAAVAVALAWWGRGRYEANQRPELSEGHRAGTPAEWGLRIVRDHQRLFDVLRRLARQHDLADVLKAIADSVGEVFEFERVVVRVYNPRSQLFEARAFYGCNGELIGKISSIDVGLTTWSDLTRKAARIGNSYRIACDDPEWPDILGYADESPSPPASLSAGRAAHELLIVPMIGDEQQVVGYVCATAAEGRRLPESDSVISLEILAFQAVHAILGARLRSKLQRRELEYSIVSEQLKDWQGMRDNFVANVSHELRTPLTSIKAYSESLDRAYPEMEADTVREFVDVILHEAERLDSVVDNLLDAAKMGNGARRQARGEIALRRLLQRVGANHSAGFERKSVSLHLVAPADEVLVHGDGELIEQVVEHLLMNALKFTPEEGRVILQLTEEIGVARILVEDDGIGIPEPDLGRIFERFYQVDASSTRSYGGQGLGLSICRDIVSWHHGRIWAENVHGGGARFVVTLPTHGLVIRERTEDGRDTTERLQWESFMQLSISLVSELLGVRVASILMIETMSNVLRIEAAVGLEEEVVQNSVVRREEGVAGIVWANGRSLLVPDPDSDERLCALSDEPTDQPRSLLSVPLKVRGDVIGVVNVHTKMNGQAFGDDDRLLLEALGERIALALQSYEIYRAGYRRLSSVESGVRALLDVGRERRTNLRDILVRCGMDAGRALELDDDHLRALAYALRTYDLGLAHVSAQILRKNTPLTAEERSRIMEHVHLGAELVADLEPSSMVRRIILHHHENVDGSGYPEGLQGEAIPVGARIVRLVDAMSALLHDRPFRPAIQMDEALALMREGVGRRFCPRVSPVFFQMIEHHRRDIQRWWQMNDGRRARRPPDIEIAHPSLTLR